MNYDAICYYWKNIDTNDIVYVGYHKTDNESGDYYTASTTNPGFHHLWNKGELERVVFFKGTVEQCISLEHYTLSKMNAKNNPIMFNESNGGGAGCDLILVDDSMKKIVSEVINGTFKQKNIASVHLNNIALAKEIVSKLAANKANGYYNTAELYIGEISNLPKIQVRMMSIHNHHINLIADRMSNPEQARKIVKPIVIVTFPNGINKLLDGNHTLRAAIKAGWQTLPVVYIPASEFNYDHSVMNDFGTEVNKYVEVKEGNSKDDVKKNILKYHEQGVAFNSEEMKALLTAKFGGEYSQSILSALIVSVRNQIHMEQQNSKYNFYPYDKEELAVYVNDYFLEHPGHGCISQSADKVIFSGIGGVVNSFRQKSKGKGWDNPKGKIFIHFSNIDDWRDRDNLERITRECLEIAKLDWVELEYLPCFIDPETGEMLYEPMEHKLAA
jgi:hypothetical protein